MHVALAFVSEHLNNVLRDFAIFVSAFDFQVQDDIDEALVFVKRAACFPGGFAYVVQVAFVKIVIDAGFENALFFSAALRSAVVQVGLVEVRLSKHLVAACALHEVYGEPVAVEAADHVPDSFSGFPLE